MSKQAQPITLGNYTRALSHQSNRSTGSLNGLKDKANNLASNKLKPTTAAQDQKPNAASKSIAAANEILGNNKPALSERVPDTQSQAGNSTLKSTQAGAPGRTLVWNNQTVSADIKRCYNCNPDVQADTEAEYYENVRRLDECGHCWSNTQKYYTGPFKLRQKGPAETLYQKDFVKHPIESGPKIKNDFWTTFNCEEPRDFTSTFAQDYKPHNVTKPKLENMAGKSSATGVPFAGRSGYKSEFINWGNMPVNIEKPPVNISVIPEIPFIGKSQNTETFVPQNGKPARPVDRDLYGTKRSPLSPGIPFMGISSYNTTYKPIPLEYIPAFPIKDEFDPTQAYPNQFETLYQQDFANHSKWKCPAKIYMENHPHPKAKYLKP